MSRIIDRGEVTERDYVDILYTERHHDHPLILEDDGTIRWKENEAVTDLMENISLNYLCPLLTSMGYGKNSEVYRKLYRDLGSSLFMYWEVFYWEANNPDAEDYTPWRRDGDEDEDME